MKTGNEESPADEAATNFFARSRSPAAKRRGIRARKNFVAAIFIAVAFFFSFFLMFHTFSYDRTRHEMRIATKAWSDFGTHIPLIRSFSYGPNLLRLVRLQPVESPLFPGEPIRYHFGMYATAGMLERLGLPVDYALNIPSALGLFLLITMIYAVSFRVFRSVAVSILTVLFFLFNGSLAFLRFFQKHPPGIQTLSDIVTNERFPAFGPWDGGTITAFWNLNIYTNQRHLGLSYGLVLLSIFLLLSPALLKRRPLLSGIFLAATTSTLLFFHQPAALIFAVFAASIFLSRSYSRMPLLIAAAVSVPALLILFQVSSTGADITWQPGYLSRDLSAAGMLRFWLDNIGLHILFIPLGLLVAKRDIRAAFLGPLLVLFVLPNLFRFSPDMINNHKFFNFFAIIGSMFSAYSLVQMYRHATRFHSLIRVFSYSFILLFVFFLTLSGIIDLFPIMNDTRGSVKDIAADPDARYILTHTAPDAVIANSTWFYHPASVAGRAIFSGYTYFTWSYGYNQSIREAEQIAVYRSGDISTLCRRLASYGIEAVELSRTPESYLSPNYSLWDSLTPDYENAESGRKIFITKNICSER